MAGANGFYSPPSPLKVCQGPAYTTHHCSVSHQALTLLPHHRPPSLHAYWLYRVCACYGFIEGFLMCLENCLMIGIMMPVGVSCLSTLSPANTKKKKKKKKQRRPSRCKPSSTSSPGCLLVLPLPFKAVQTSSCQSELYHVHRFVTGGTFVTISPLQNSLFMPQHNVTE